MRGRHRRAVQPAGEPRRIGFQGAGDRRLSAVSAGRCGDGAHHGREPRRAAPRARLQLPVHRSPAADGYRIGDAHADAHVHAGTDADPGADARPRRRRRPRPLRTPRHWYRRRRRRRPGRAPPRHCRRTPPGATADRHRHPYGDTHAHLQPNADPDTDDAVQRDAAQRLSQCPERGSSPEGRPRRRHAQLALDQWLCTDQ